MTNRRNMFYALLIVFLVAGALTERSFFFHLAYVLVALLAGSFLWSWTAVNFLRIGRFTHARRAQVGRTLDESFVVHNTGILPKLWLEVRDHSDLPNHNASHVVQPCCRASGTAGKSTRSARSAGNSRSVR